MVLVASFVVAFVFHFEGWQALLVVSGPLSSCMVFTVLDFKDWWLQNGELTSKLINLGVGCLSY